MNKECSECQGKCCVGVIEVFPEDEIYNDLILTKSSIQADYDRVMITDKEHKCIALINGTCSIYDKRPQICRAFKVNSECCIKFRNGELKSHTCEKCCLIVSRNIHIQNQMVSDFMEKPYPSNMRRPYHLGDKVDQYYFNDGLVQIDRSDKYHIITEPTSILRQGIRYSRETDKEWSKWYVVDCNGRITASIANKEITPTIDDVKKMLERIEK